MPTSNLDGQRMRRKGRATRERLMDATAVLLASTPLRELRAADVARAAGTSPATLYLYFQNVEDIALALADQAAQAAAPIIAIARMDWSAGERKAMATRFVEAYFTYWDSYRPILRVRNLAAEEGDARFLENRLKVSVPLHEALAEKIDQGAAGRPEIRDYHSLTLAAVAVASLERTAATYLTYPREFGVTRPRLIEASVYMLLSVLGTAQG